VETARLLHQQGRSGKGGTGGVCEISKGLRRRSSAFFSFKTFFSLF
jgi:hypothetical protein